MKGITLKYENSKVVNFTILRDMILENAPPVHVHNPRKIKRKHGGVVVSEPETKEYKFVFKKRRLMEIVTPYPMDISVFIYLFICINGAFYALNFI